MTAVAAICVAVWQYEVHRQKRIARENEIATELISNVSETWRGFNYQYDVKLDALAISRAVNHLRMIGHERTFDALANFAVSNPDRNNLHVLLPYLLKPNDSLPPYNGDFSESNGLVFYIGTSPGFTGMPRQNNHLDINSMRMIGQIVDADLTPSGHPCDAAEAVLLNMAKDPHYEPEDLPDNRWLIYSQVFDSLSHLLENKYDFEIDSEWNRCLDELKSKSIEWNAELMSYVDADAG